MIATGPPLVLVALTAVIVKVAVSPGSASVSLASKVDFNTLTPTAGNRSTVSEPATGSALTATVNEQTALLPSPSTFVQVTVLIPTGKVDPLDGVQVVPVIVQFVKVGVVQVTLVLLLWPESALTKMSGGQTKSTHNVSTIT